jgi:uncharacterized Zn finger protein
VRSGCVIDLDRVRCCVPPGQRPGLFTRFSAFVTTPKPRWQSVCHDVGGAIDSLVELLKGDFSKSVMERLCQQETGLFPKPSEIKFKCSCPDSARMCKHISAVLYGIGARLDENPELLFLLRNVNLQDLITTAGERMTKPKTRRVLEGANLSELLRTTSLTDRERNTKAQKAQKQKIGTRSCRWTKFLERWHKKAQKDLPGSFCAFVATLAAGTARQLLALPALTMISTRDTTPQHDEYESTLDAARYRACAPRDDTDGNAAQRSRLCADGFFRRMDIKR